MIATWKRWGQWAAHLFNEQGQMCSTQHGQFPGFDPTKREPSVAELGPHGIPYGPVCTYCLKAFRRLTG
jgi:hypothetical protein